MQRSKDDFLLALSQEKKADYLVTGDKDLLSIGKLGQTLIATADNFSKIIEADEKQTKKV